MASIDITKAISLNHRFDRPAGLKLMDIIEWLTENVGECYGSGRDRTVPANGSEIFKIGKGWQIQRSWKTYPDAGYANDWWEVDIDDDAMATLFALKWIK